MSSLKEKLNRLTLRNPQLYFKMTAWRMADTVVSSLPTAVMVVAAYYLLQPLGNPGAPLDPFALWACAAALVAQAALSYAMSKKAYVLQCEGLADIAFEECLVIGEKLRRLPMGYYNRHDAGEIESLLTRDFDKVENYGSEILAQTACILVRLLLFSLALCAIDLRLAAAFLAVVPLALPFLIGGFQGLARVSGELTSAVHDAEAKSIEYAGGIRTLRAFGLAGERFGSLEQAFDRLRRMSIRKEAALRPVSVFGRLVLSCGIGVVMFAGSGLLLGGELDPFGFLVLLLVALNFYEPLISLFYFLSEFADADKAAQRIDDMLAEPELAEPEAGGPEPAGFGPAEPETAELALARSEEAAAMKGDPVRGDAAARPADQGAGCAYRFEDVRFSYGEGEALRGVSFTVPKRALCALVGRSGSGKSSAVKLMARFWDPQEGRVDLEGRPLPLVGTQAVLFQVSIVFQNVYLFQDTVAENIRMGREGATDEEVRDAARRAGCLEFIDRLPLGFDTMVGEGGSTLSGGEKQRVSIARALLKDASIVLLDEATASLDPQNEVLVQHAISELVRDRTVVVIAHRLKSIRHADRIVVLDAGLVVEEGSHEELLALGGRYASMWAEQMRASAWRLGPSA